MTEYDYSPEAYERYIESQHKIARWVDRTNMLYPELRNPFDPATPAPDLSPIELPPESRWYRNAHKEDWVPERGAYTYPYHRYPDERGKDGYIERNGYGEKEGGGGGYRERPKAYRTPTQAPKIYTYEEPRPAPVRSQTAPLKTPKPRRGSHDRHDRDPSSSSKYDYTGSRYDLTSNGKHEYSSRGGSKYDLTKPKSKPTIYDQNHHKYTQSSDLIHPQPVYASKAAAASAPIQPNQTTRTRPSRSQTLPPGQARPQIYLQQQQQQQQQQVPATAIPVYPAKTPLYAPPAPAAVYPHQPTPQRHRSHPPITQAQGKHTPPRGQHYSQPTAPPPPLQLPPLRPRLQRQGQYQPVIPDPIPISAKPPPLLKRLFTGLTGSKNVRAGSPESPTSRSGESSPLRSSFDGYVTRPLSGPVIPRRERERERGREGDRGRGRRGERESDMRRRGKSH